MYTYQPRTDFFLDELGTLYIVYGVEVKDSTGQIVASVPDVFLTHSQIDSFIELCNVEQLDPVHLLEVIDNELAKG